ncbi:MAG: aminotransferase class IV family protein [Phycisphaeraceae bacterium]|nr:aminotransferase class IV family protein [Phycisphaeraceae bacterium]
MDVFLNGQIVPESQATVSIHDAGFQHAVGLFETMSAVNGKVFRLQQHLDRLKLSAESLGLTPTLETAPLAEAVNQILAHNKLTEARIRLTLTAGAIPLLKSEEPIQPLPTLLIVPSEPTNYDPAYFQTGITVLIAPAGANPFDPMAGHKTLSYWPRLRTLRQAASAGAGEAIWLNVTNHLASGAISNIFLVKDGVLLTPFARGEEVDQAIPAPVLPGITRAAVIELAAKQNIQVKKQMLSIDDLLTADEAFLTNSSWQILPVSHVEKKQISEGKAGPLTSQLRTSLLELIQKETQ